MIGIGFYVFSLTSAINIDPNFQEFINLTNFYDPSWYQPYKYSFLEYMLKLQDTVSIKNTTSSQFDNECNKPVYQFTTYHALVYVYICIVKNKQKFEVLCSELQLGEGKKQPFKEMLQLQNSTFAMLDDNIFSQGSANLQKSACHNIEQYVSVREVFENNIRKKSSSHKNGIVTLKYNENTLEDVPFCVPFTCPYWISEQRKTSYKQNAYDCMPFSCRVIFWVIFSTDAVFAISIIIANVMIIIVIKKTPHLLTPHG